MKFQATYRVTVYTQKETVIIDYPLTCKFNITRGVLCDSNDANIQILNLAPSTREKVFQDVFTLDESQWKYVKVEAGYNNSLTQIFLGRILQAYSYRSGGSVDVTTEIQAKALDIFDRTSSYFFAAGTTYKEAYNTIASDLPNVTQKATGDIQGTFQTPTTFEGKTLDCLNQITGGNTFVDNEALCTLLANEVLDVPVPVITEKNGLLETPRRRDANLEVKMLFEPTLQVGQLLEIKSSVAPQFNGQFKVIGFTHDCLISGAAAGTRTTTVNLWIGTLLPNAQIIYTNNQVENNFNKVKNDKIEPVNLTIPADARSAYRYMQQNNGAIPPTMITNNISWAMMVGHDNTNAERLAECDISVCVNCYNTAVKLQGIIDKLYKGKSIKITSGWRSSANNRRCNGALKSRHLIGTAVDFKIVGVNPQTVYAQMSGLWNFRKLYSSWVHVDDGAGVGIANDR